MDKRGKGSFIYADVRPSVAKKLNYGVSARIMGSMGSGYILRTKGRGLNFLQRLLWRSPNLIPCYGTDFSDVIILKYDYDS